MDNKIDLIEPILNEMHTNFKDKISLDEFLSVMKSNTKLQQVVCPSLSD